MSLLEYQKALHDFNISHMTLQQRRIAQILQNLAGVGLAGDYTPAPLYLRLAIGLTESGLVSRELARYLNME